MKEEKLKIPKMPSLVTSVDELLADLEICISDIQQKNEAKQQRIDSATALSFTGPPSPMLDHHTIHSAPIYEPKIHNGPKDTKFSTITALPDAFGGWLNRASYSSFLGKRSLKRKYYVVANSTLYVYNSDDSDSVCDRLCEFNANWKVSIFHANGISNTIDLYTEKKQLVIPSPGGGARVYAGATMGEAIVRKSYELQCRDLEEMEVWLDVFAEAIEDVVNGKVAIKFETQKNNDSKAGKRATHHSSESKTSSSSSGGVQSNTFLYPVEDMPYEQRGQISRSNSFNSTYSKKSPRSPIIVSTNFFAQTSLIDDEERKKKKKDKKQKELADTMSNLLHTF